MADLNDPVDPAAKTTDPAGELAAAEKPADAPAEKAADAPAEKAEDAKPAAAAEKPAVEAEPATETDRVTSRSGSVPRVAQTEDTEANEDFATARSSFVSLMQRDGSALTNDVQQLRAAVGDISSGWNARPRAALLAAIDAGLVMELVQETEVGESEIRALAKRVQHRDSEWAVCTLSRGCRIANPGDAADKDDATSAATPAAETKPVAETTLAGGTKPAETEAESGTVLPDSVVSGAAGVTAASADSDEEADDSEDADTAPPSAKPARKPRRKISRPRLLVAALSLQLVVVLVASVVLFVHNHKVRTAEADRIAALGTAREVATSLTTITPDNAAGQIDALTKQSTGSFKDQIAGYSAMFQAVLKQGNVASRGTITAAGIEKMEGDAASAIVAVSALITSGQVPQGQPRTYRLLVSLQRDGDHWLASNVDFVQ